jgi:signal-transduction protein with cAMP-binding, CBS, and nucleotidyltransferase domain
VVEEDGKLVGMITDTDVLSAIIRSFYSVYVHDQRRTMTLDSFSALSKEFENSAVFSSEEMSDPQAQLLLLEFLREQECSVVRGNGRESGQDGT